jgi:predicted nucleotide-binding protein
MGTTSEKLFQLADRLEAVWEKWAAADFIKNLDSVKEAAEVVGAAWSGSWLGYQSRVYYAGFQTPPPGAHFSREWGLSEYGTSGDWREFDFQSVTESIRARAKVTLKDLEEPGKLSDQLDEEFEECRSEFLSLITVALQQGSDEFLNALKIEAEKLKIFSASQYAETLQPQAKFITRDMMAMNQGFQVSPHVNVQAHIFELEQPAKACEKLTKLCRRAASHLESRDRQDRREQRIGTKIFIGHGRSRLWKDLKDFVQDRLKLPPDEFNRVPVAGVTNIARLSEMLDDAAIAFLVMTAEDEQRDGSVRARMNVIHEAGLFQGRLGFTKAILLLEDGCEEFSNIHGLGQIRFPKGNIEAAFEDVRQVLEREGIL